MARGKDRHSKPTQPFDARRLAKLAEEPPPAAEAAQDQEDASEEWAALASGTPPRNSTPVLSRTTTRHDPLTTELLAEVTRRPTQDLSEETPPLPEPPPTDPRPRRK